MAANATTQLIHRIGADVIGTIHAIHRTELRRDPSDHEIATHLAWHLEQKDGGWGGEQIQAFVRGLEEWHEGPPEPPPVPLPTAVPRLVTRGSFFATAEGEPHFLRDASSFKSYQKFLTHDGSVIAHLRQLKALGFNTSRVFLMCRNMWDLDPAKFPEFYRRLPEYVQFSAREGIRPNLVVFPDVKLVRNDLPWQLEHWQHIGEVLQPVVDLCPLISFQNELEQPPNQTDASRFGPLPNLLCSHGSSGSQALPPRPWWQFEEMHFNDASEWWRKSGHNSKEITDGDPEGHIAPSYVPVHASENTRPDRDGNPTHHHDAAAAAALLCAGYCFHSIPGRTSDILTGHDLTCAQAAAAGMASVPLHCQPGGYRHRTELEGPADLRVYQRGGDDACIVRVRK